MSQLVSQSSKLYFGPLRKLDKIIITKHSADLVRDKQFSNKKTCKTKFQQFWKLVK